jgi:hypothetical protein
MFYSGIQAGELRKSFIIYTIVCGESLSTSTMGAITLHQMKQAIGRTQLSIDTYGSRMISLSRI